MGCKLFDIAAFGDWRQIHAMNWDRLEREALKNWRQSLRKAVFLDASSINDAWTTWLSRPGEYRKELVRALPPWQECFVYAGYETSESGLRFEWGQQMKLAETSVVNKDGLLASGGQQAVEIYEAADWCIANMLWMRPSKSNVVKTFWKELLFLDRDGKFLATMLMSSNKQIQSHVNTITQWSLGLFAFQLMHCKNVTTKEAVYRPTMPKGKGDKSPKVRYHTLAISDTLVRREGSEPSGEHPGKAKHVCRGNFAHYTEEKPLFGKYTGMFWRPMHIRGSAKHGIVGKEYAMAEPSAN